jgi:hypothetical protein
MGHLVRTLSGENIVQELQQAYAVLARAYLRHRTKELGNVANADLLSLDTAVLASESLVNLVDARAECQLIETGCERPGEMFNQLCHIYVLLAAASALTERGLRPHICAPTQQSADARGGAIPDLGGPRWFLEAYGGVDYGHNGKLAKDLRVLSRLSGSSSTPRLFVAYRESAWHRNMPLSSSAFNPVVHTCPKKHGGPFRASAEGQLFLISSGVAVAELRNIVISDQT